MIKYTVRDIIKRAEQLADLENSDFISWKENFDLINEAWRGLYQDTINNGDNYNIAVLDKEKYQISTGYYKLPTDFYQLKSIVDKNSKQALSRREPTQTDINNNTYEIINGELKVFSSADVEIVYYRTPQVLYFAPLPKEVDVDYLLNIIGGENIYDLLNSKRLLLSYNENKLLVLYRSQIEGGEEIINSTKLYLFDNGELLKEIDLSDKDGYYNDEVSSTINNITLTNDWFTVESNLELFGWRISTEEEIHHIIQVEVAYASNVKHADNVEKAELVQEATTVTHADEYLTNVERAENVEYVESAGEVNHADTVTTAINTLVQAQAVQEAQFVENTKTVNNANVVANVNTATNIATAEKVQTAQNIENANSISNANNITTAANIENADNVVHANNVESADNVNTINKADTVTDVTTVTNAVQVDEAQTVQNAKNVIGVENVVDVTSATNVNTVTNVTNVTGTIDNAETVNTINNFTGTIANAETVETITNFNGNIENVAHADSVENADKAGQVTRVAHADVVENYESNEAFDWVISDKASATNIPKDATNILLKQVETDEDITIDCGGSPNNTGSTAAQYNAQLSWATAGSIFKD